MNASRFISERLDFRGRITVAATAVSFFIIIIAVTVADGFRVQVRDGVSELMGDVQLSVSGISYYGEGEPVDLESSYMQDLRDAAGVKSLTPVIYRTGIVRKGSDIQGVLVKAVPSEDTTALGVSVPKDLAERLSLVEGDTMTTYFVGDRVKARNFKVKDIYSDLLRTDGNMIVLASLEDMQRVNGWTENQASALEARLSGRWRERSAARGKASELSMLTAAREGETPLVGMSAADRYSQLFDWISLLDFNVFTLLLLMTLVAGFNMVSGLLIMLFRHTGTIGTLKALGMSDRGISEAFLRVGSRIVLKGMAIGNAAALLFCLLQGTTHLLRLNPENYFVSFVPVWVNLPKILAADALAWAAIMLLLLLPTVFISRVDPSETVRMK